MNSDGLMDLIVGNREGQIFFLLNELRSSLGVSFSDVFELNFHASTQASLDAFDLDGDGLDDLIVGDGDGKVRFASPTRCMPSAMSQCGQRGICQATSLNESVLPRR